MDTDILRLWFEREKRALPWRENPTFYRVWVSEVMLQQTQAAVVVPYFERWMKKFPTMRTLAQASQEEVIKMWEGLGYYSRARNLLSGAQQLVEWFGDTIPQDETLLLKIKGLGPYTRGAIRSFAWGQKAAAVDGNVVRVIARYFCLEDEVDTAATKKKIEKSVFSLLPDSHPWVIMEALIELGALICQKVPICSRCPLKNGCRGVRSGLAHELPKKRKKEKSLLLKRRVMVIFFKDEVLVKRGEPGKVMADLYEFPYFEEGAKERFEVEGKEIEKLPIVKHTFTRFRATLIPTLVEAKQKTEHVGYQWVKISSLLALPFSSGHRQIAGILRGKYAHFTH